ncbi:MAG: insulinase family protein [Sandaracinaceae bacterium]|nr:insulinase family protein [Sandaracinaceae bacterium]
MSRVVTQPGPPSASWARTAQLAPRSRFATLLMLVWMVGCGATGGLPAPTHPLTRAPDEPFRRHPPEILPGPPLRAPALSEVQLPNGLTLIVVPRPGWPTVSVALVTRATELDYEPGALELSSAYIARLGVLRQPDTVLGFGAGLTGAAVTGTAQTRDLETVLDAFAEAIVAELDTRAMQQARAELLLDEEMSASSPLGAGRSFAMQALYLPSASFGALRRDRYRAVANVSPPLLSVVTRDAFRPADTAVILVGDITAERARALVEPRLGAPYEGRPRATRSAPPAHDTQLPLGAGSMRSSQLQLVYGLPAPQLHEDDWAAYQVLEAVLAGGFTSSLNTRIRHQLGASYGVRWGSWFDYPGHAAFIEARIDAERAVPALTAFFTELTRVRQAPLGEAELDRARRVVWGEWEARFATPGGLLGVCQRAFSARMSVDDVAARAEATRHVSASAVHGVATVRLRPARNVVVLTGPLEALRGYQVTRSEAGFALVPAPLGVPLR